MVEKSSRTLENTELEKAEQEDNDQIIGFEEDIFLNRENDQLPF